MRPGSSLVSHSQMTSTRQPSLFSAEICSVSLATLRSNFARQTAELEVGIVARSHRLCWCQKQPWTKIAFLRLGKTISGFPGKSRRWSRNRYPIWCAIRRTRNSGPVFVLRTALMFALRCAAGILSVMLQISLTAIRRPRVVHPVLPDEPAIAAKFPLASPQ